MDFFGNPLPAQPLDSNLGQLEAEEEEDIDEDAIDEMDNEVNIDLDQVNDDDFMNSV